MNAIEFLKQLVEEIEKMENSGQVDAEKQEKPEIILTERQKTAIKGRIAEGYKYVFRNKDVEHVTFSDEEPEVYENGCFTLPGRRDSFTFSNFYDFVTFENSPLYLPYLLGGGEE